MPYHKETFVDINAADKYRHVVGTAILQFRNDLHSIQLVGLQKHKKERLVHKNLR